MPKNVTIYIPDQIAEKMEKFPEVNWSEICRKAVIDYIDTRSQIDIAPILEKLKAKGNEDYKQGQIFFYKIAPQMTLSHFESWYPDINKHIIESKISPPSHSDREPYWEAAEIQAFNGMRYHIKSFCKMKNVEAPKYMSDAFCKGAIDAFMKIYNAAKQKRR
jgi:predicted nucleic acid-binding protein